MGASESLPEMVATGVVMAAFALSIIGTVWFARPRSPTQLNRLGLWSMFIPTWNFFAPDPGTHDYCVLYRDNLVSGAAGLWSEIGSFCEVRRWYSFLWNPEKLRKKALFDLSMALAEEVASVLPDQKRGSKAFHVAQTSSQEWPIVEGSQFDPVKLSLPYLTLLVFVMSQPRTPFSVSRQFMIARLSRSRNEFEPLLVSSTHVW